MVYATTKNASARQVSVENHVRRKRHARTSALDTEFVFSIDVSARRDTLESTAQQLTRRLCQPSAKVGATVVENAVLASAFASPDSLDPTAIHALISSAPSQRAKHALVTANVCTTNAFACLVLLGRHVRQRPSALMTALVMAHVPTAFATASRHFEVQTATQPWHARMTATHAVSA